MSKLHKKDFLVELQTLIVHQAPTEKHNEITVAIGKYALPTKKACFLTPKLLESVKKVAVAFPRADIKFNYNEQTPAFLFTCKGRTERRGNDVHNQELADKIATSKCMIQAHAIGGRILKAMRNVLEEDAVKIKEMTEFLDYHADRERNYIRKM